MSRSLGVARVMSVKTIQMRCSGLIHWRKGAALIGLSSDATILRRSSARPGTCEGLITVVHPSGNSTARVPLPYASSTFIAAQFSVFREQVIQVRFGKAAGKALLA